MPCTKNDLLGPAIRNQVDTCVPLTVTLSGDQNGNWAPGYHNEEVWCTSVWRSLIITLIFLPQDREREKRVCVSWNPGVHLSQLKSTLVLPWMLSSHSSIRSAGRKSVLVDAGTTPAFSVSFWINCLGIRGPQESAERVNMGWNKGISTFPICPEMLPPASTYP